MTVAFQVDTSSVERLRDTLQQTKSAGSDAAGGLRDAGNAAEQMERSFNQLVAQQQRTNDLLQSGNLHVNTYADSLLKLATAGAAITAAYVGVTDAIGLVNRGLQDQVSIVGHVRDGLADLAAYGGNAFKLVTDQAVAAQRALSDVATQAGSTGATFATFLQQMAPTGASPQSVSGAFGTLTYNLAHPASPQGSLAGQTLAAYGISANGSPDTVGAAFLNTLHGVQAGPERTQAAENVFGPGGADLIKDTIAGIAKVTDMERALNQLREDNATAERQAAEARRQSDEAARAWFEQHSVAAFFADHLFGSTNAAAARDVTGGNFTGNLTALAQQAVGERPGMGAGAWFANLGRTFNPWGAEPSFPSTTALDYGQKPAPDMLKGLSDLATAGVQTPQILKDLTDQLARLNDDLSKGNITSDQFSIAYGNLTARETNLVDPLQRILMGTNAGASLGQFAPGYQRGLESYLRSAGVAAGPAAGKTPDQPATRLSAEAPTPLRGFSRVRSLLAALPGQAGLSAALNSMQPRSAA